MPHNPFYNIENPELVGYEYAWVSYFKNGEVNENIISGDILASWERCKAKGLDATSRNVEFPVSAPEELDRKRKENAGLLANAKPILEGLVNVPKKRRMDVCVVDCDGVVLRMVSDNEAESSIGVIGGHFAEDAAGTNCLALTLRHRKMVAVTGAQHYFQQNHKYAGYAAPIQDGSGELLGAIGIFVRLEHMSDYMISIAAMAAKAIENGISLFRSNEMIVRQNNEKEDILDSVTDGIVYADKNLVITHANHQFTKFTGLGKEELIGNNIGRIKMTPRIGKPAESGTVGHNNLRVKLYGAEKTYNCLLNCHPIEGRGGERENTIWIFTAIDEIREMADKIDVENRAFFTFDSIIGKSGALLECVELAKKVADRGARVIIEGESGTGKEIIAQSIHNRGARRDGPFVAVDCGAIPRELLESEIFGYEEGAYTGARKGGHRGKFELAHRGTLFLDEIGNMPPDMQVKLLRVLQDNRVVRIGGYNPIHVDVQIIAATNQDLVREVEAGTFREDLYYRLDVVHIKLPPLRERKEDIPLLARRFIRNNRRKNMVKEISEDAMQIICNYGWPGNVRQLHNVLERMIVMTDGNVLTKDLIPEEISLSTDNPAYAAFDARKIETLELANAKYVNNVLKEFNGNIKRAAECLDVSRATVYRILRNAGFMQKNDSRRRQKI
ncbi:MAG: sigma 54-interacting transcriptional regulator [Clostridiales Family XIII bacterium]|jgi:transcriptional regulator with PAS, ATPase and Fis domain|nr:sigma 54-interacting transcriptional regulator [Clostridiales Family XIII bacterium]